MKNVILFMTVVFAMLLGERAMAQQGFGTNTPDKSAAVDIQSSKRGLLIPRIQIDSETSSLPVRDAANSLMVYNTGSNSLAEGYYYWKRNNLTDPSAGGKWIKIATNVDDKYTVVEAGTNIKVDTQVSADSKTTTYNVSVKEGTAKNQVLVTRDDSGTLTSVWVDPEEFIKDVIVGQNGVTVGVIQDGADTKTVIKLGGALTETTTINADTHTLAITGLKEWTNDTSTGEYSFVVMGDDGVLKKVAYSAIIPKGDLKGDNIIRVNGGDSAVLSDISLEVVDRSITVGKLSSRTDTNTADTSTGTFADSGTVATADGNGGVQWKAVNDLVEVNNGLEKNDSGVIQLGGELVKPTDIKTGDSNTLAISGLTGTNEASNLVYVEQGTGILRSGARSLSATATSDTFTVADINGYSSIIQDVNIIATLGSSDINIALPTASAANNGQVVNISIGNTDESDYYVNIIDGAVTLTYGAMPHQSWIVKSNGSKWVIVGRN